MVLRDGDGERPRYYENEEVFGLDGSAHVAPLNDGGRTGSRQQELGISKGDRVRLPERRTEREANRHTEEPDWRELEKLKNAIDEQKHAKLGGRARIRECVAHDGEQETVRTNKRAEAGGTGLRLCSPCSGQESRSDVKLSEGEHGSEETGVAGRRLTSGVSGERSESAARRG